MWWGDEPPVAVRSLWARQMTGHKTTIYVWRPSMFAPCVVHLTREGDPAYTSDRYPGRRWVYGACGQNTAADGIAGPDSVQCPECVEWLRINPA